MPVTGRVLVVLGVVLFGISILADYVGLGRYPGFGIRQTAGAVLGVLLVVAAFVVRSRRARSDEQGSPDSSP